jgi:hypothetical protein
MTEQPKFEVGKHYRTERGRKATCVHIWPGDGVHFVCDGPPRDFWTVHNDGTYAPGNESAYDIVGEWREPRTWTVYVIEYADGSVGVSLQDVCSTRGSRRARVTVTEGQGLESGRSDFEKDMM